LGGHVGFTATTSDKAANIDISSWTLKTVEVDPGKTVFVENSNNTLVNASSIEAATNSNTSAIVNEVVADGVSLSPGLTIRTFDGCDNPLDSGTLEGFIQAVYVERPNNNNTYFNGSLVPAVVEAHVLDNGDGSYAVQFATTVEAAYELWIVFGEGCSLNFSVPENPDSLYLFNATLVRQDDALCFFSRDPEAGESLPYFPPTPAPTTIPADANTDEIPLVAIIAGSSSFLLVAIMVGIVMLRYRRKWLANKRFVADGKAYLLDAATAFDEDTPYSRTAGEVMRTQAEINRRRAEAAGVDGRNEIVQLQDEIEERKEVIRMQRKKMGYDLPPAQMMETTNPRFRQKNEF